MPSFRHALRTLRQSSGYTLTAVLTIVLAAVAIAAYVPARRAARADPNTLLREG
jgi:ABC-type antimicrobial peptide transport system permease subunit